MDDSILGHVLYGHTWESAAITFCVITLHHDIWRFSVGQSLFFFYLCRKYQIVFCYNVIEKNKRRMLPMVRSSTGGDCVTAKTNPLDSFFPFDPYLLKRQTHSSPSYPFIFTFINTLKIIKVKCFIDRQPTNLNSFWLNTDWPTD